MAQVPLVSVNLANIAIESFLYGIFFILNAGSIALLIYPRHQPSVTSKTRENRFKAAVKKPMFIGAIALFVGITGHWICTVMRLFAAMSTYKDGKEPLEYYSDISQNVYAIKTGFLEASLIIGDAMLVYRLWKVWNMKYWVIALPCLSLLGLIVCGIGLVNDFVHYAPGRSVFSPGTQAWVLGDGLFTLVTNVYSSSFIAWRIWRTDRRTRYSGASRLIRSKSLISVLAIFIESALLYTSWTVVFIVTYAVESHIEALIADCWAVTAGISFGLINVRVGMGWANKTASSITSTLPRFRGEANTAEEDMAYPMQTLAIHVHQVKNIMQSPEVVSFPDNSKPQSHPEEFDRPEKDEV
ncbi:hypothetical protein VNI00_005133 [Paramarasmius palmivorus]|uniref:Uncharacterized protein n=1 Tax=Paramarasmius palmivorus TaxID=297713 RepID=A0AAW0DEM3_9AGAR